MNRQFVLNRLEQINSFNKQINIMEVCGTHTMAIGKYGIRDLLNKNINLISGPGCPVCVTPNHYIDYVYNLSLKEDIIIATYGDMMRVPGSMPNMTLEKAKANGASVKMVYSSMDAVQLAAENLNKKVVFLGIGFETTAPATAVAIMEAEKNKLDNFFVMCLHKLVEPVMRLLLEDKTLKVDGFLCPGHVAVIIGEQGFKFLESYNCASAIAGFEMEEILDGIYYLASDIETLDFSLKNAYSKLVKQEGNLTALKIIEEVFEPKDDYWRGIGLIKNSGLRLKNLYRKYDIEEIYPLENKEEIKSNGCQCGEVLKGKIRPYDCKLFGKVCTPDYPIGPCMVSGEGSCAAYYRFKGV